MAQETSAEMSALPRSGTIAGKVVAFHPLTIDDFAAMDDAIRQAALASILPVVQGDRERVSAAVATVMQLNFGQRWEYNKALQVTAVWFSLRRGNAKLTRDDVWKMFASAGLKQSTWTDLDAAFSAVLIVSGLLPDPLEKNPDPTPATPQTSQ
jgi:hypothetical protein